MLDTIVRFNDTLALVLVGLIFAIFAFDAAFSNHQTVTIPLFAS